tara:strand:- start:5313 stop:5591 length:279 start_codon:yes stop_codon:yes gene_type:complete
MNNNKYKFKNPYINKCLNILNNNDIDIKILNIEYDKIIKSTIVNGSMYDIKRDIIKLSYDKEVYIFNCNESLYTFIKDIVDLNRLYEEVFIN